MILRTVFLLGLGVAQPAAQPAGLAVAAGPAARVQVDRADQEVSPRAQLGRDLASWRVDLITQSEAPSMLVALQALVVRGESLVIGAPDDVEAVELLTELYVEEFTQAERGLGIGPLQALFLKRLRAAHELDTSPAAVSMARASTAVVTVERIEQLIGTALSAQADVATDPLARRRLRPQAQMLSAAVEDALRTGEEEFIGQLGTAAVEPLRQAALKITGERPPGGQLDPLRLLVKVNPAAALDVALVHVQAEDLLLKVRVVDAFGAQDPFTAESVWTATPSGAFELVRPEWAEIVAALYREPAVRESRADPFLRTLAQRGYAPLGLQTLLPGCLTRLPLPRSQVRPVVVEAARDLLASADVDEQLAGLRLILLSPSVAPAWELASSTSASVRELMADAFGPRQIAAASVLPQLDAAYREALGTFLLVADEGEGVATAAALRGAATMLATGGEALIQPGTLIALLERSPALHPASLLAALPHVAQLAERDRSLVMGAATRTVLRGMESGDAVWAAQAPSVLQSLLGAALGLGDAEAFLAVLHEEADADVWRQVIEVSRFKSNLTRFSPHLQRLSAKQQMRIVHALWRTGYDHFDWFSEDELTLRRDHWLELAADETLPHPARIWALEAMAGEEGSPAPAGAAAELAGIVADLGRCPISSRELMSMGLDPEEYLRHLLDLPGVPADAVLDVYIDVKKGETVERLLERFPASDWGKYPNAPLLSSVISALVKRRDPALNKALLAANIRRTPIQKYLVDALNAERFVGHLPLGGAVLRTGLVEQDTAIEFVASFMTDDAARYLVEAMETAHTESYRDKLFAALQGLTERREVAERWMRSSNAAARREAAVLKLLEVMDAKTSTVEARSEAIKGLGLLDARDELPRLIALLESDDERLRLAAREAIDRMGQ
jgi:hypothetical protein